MDRTWIMKPKPSFHTGMHAAFVIFCSLCLLSISFVSGCTNGSKTMPASTIEMAAELNAIAEHTYANPNSNVHVNKARVQALRAVEPPANPQRLVSYLSQLGQELLNAGNNTEAIATFQRILDIVESDPDTFGASYRLGALDFLALSYLRLGEEENCLENHSIDRCLLPIRESGVHTIERGSKNAAKLLKTILEEDPDDLNARWLLNVAHMTLGTYPDSVPEPWRIPPDVFESEYDIKRFEDIAMQRGVDVMGLSGGVVLEDLNNDGYLDIMASSWGLQDQVKYFEQEPQTGMFVDKTKAALLTGIVGGLNLVHADYDNDGHIDILVLRGAWLGQGHPNSLLRNRGNGTFEDVTKAAGVYSFHPTQTADWGDFDNDGDLDLFVGNESSPEGGRHRCELYRNNGDGTFTNIAREVGLGVIRYVKAAVWGDIDNDDDLDLFISDWQGNNLLLQNGGAENDWQFTDVSRKAGIEEPLISFPAWFWDYDNDGWEDLFVSGWRASAGDIAADYMGLPHGAEYPRLYRNKGDGTFENTTADAGLARVMYSMGSNFGDLDNDGFLDFYVGTGDPDLRTIIPNRMFRNKDGVVFQDVTSSGGFGHLQKGHGVAYGDIDRDGDQDIYAVIGGAYEGDVFGNALFENPGHDNHWITLLLEGKTSNRDAIGVRIKVTVREGNLTREIHRTVGTGGTFGSSSLQQEIGLGQAEAIEEISIYWPTSKTQQAFTDVAMNHAYHIHENQNRLKELY